MGKYCRRLLIKKKTAITLGFFRLLFSIPCFSISPSFYQFPRCDRQLRDRRCCNDETLKGLSNPRTALVFWSAPGSCLGRGHLSELSDKTRQILTMSFLMFVLVFCSRRCTAGLYNNIKTTYNIQQKWSFWPICYVFLFTRIFLWSKPGPKRSLDCFWDGVPPFCYLETEP